MKFSYILVQSMTNRVSEPKTSMFVTVKNKLSRTKQLDSLAKLIKTAIKTAIKIDNCIYKRTLEQKGQYRFGTNATKTKSKTEEKKP